MSVVEIDQIVTVLAAVVAILGGAAAIVANRRKPTVDKVTADQIEAKIKKDNQALQGHRDQRVLDLEVWADKMRPVLWKIKERDERLTTVVAEQAALLQMPDPHIPPFPEIPEFPEPRPLPS